MHACMHACAHLLLWSPGGVEEDLVIGVALALLPDLGGRRLCLDGARGAGAAEPLEEPDVRVVLGRLVKLEVHDRLRELQM